MIDKFLACVFMPHSVSMSMPFISRPYLVALLRCFDQKCFTISEVAAIEL